MSKTDRELLQSACDALDAVHHVLISHNQELIEEIRARLAEPEPEPVAWLRKNSFRFCCEIEPQDDSEIPLYRHPPRPARLSDEEILTLAEKYGTSETRLKPTYHLHDGSPTGETYPQVDWLIGQEDLLGFARELLEKNK